MPSKTAGMVWVALAADLGVALAKVAAAVFTAGPHSRLRHHTR
jgi:hypothetical protein